MNTTRRHPTTRAPRLMARLWPLAVVAVWAVACFAFLQVACPYQFFYKEQNQLFLCSWDFVATYPAAPGWVARLAGDFLTQFFYYLYAGAALVALCLLPLAVLLAAALRRLGVPRWVALGAGLAVATLEALMQSHYDFPLSAALSAGGWAGALWLWALCQGRWLRLLAAPVLGGLAWWLFGVPRVTVPSGPSRYAEQQLAVDSEYHFGHYDRVLSIVDGTPRPTPEMKFFYNLVRARRGELPDYLLHFDHNELGTFYQIGPDSPMQTIKNMNELYWALGDMTFTERAAMMGCVFSPNNRNVRMIRRLAECNIVSGDTLAAEKYLRLLDQTFVYRGWARNVRENGGRTYQHEMQLVNRRDTITLSDNAHFLMMQLLDANPQNLVALDYLLCSDLLLKDITNFKRDYDRYCSQHPRTKTVYQEALCIWLAGTEAPSEQWAHYIKSEQVLNRFLQYNAQRGSAAFSDTYWYYFDRKQETGGRRQ